MRHFIFWSYCWSQNIFYGSLLRLDKNVSWSLREWAKSEIDVNNAHGITLYKAKCLEDTWLLSKIALEHS